MNIFSLPNEKGYSRFFCTKGIFGGFLWDSNLGSQNSEFQGNLSKNDRLVFLRFVFFDEKTLRGQRSLSRRRTIFFFIH